MAMKETQGAALQSTAVHPYAAKRKMTFILLPVFLIIASVGSLMIGQISFSVAEVVQGIFQAEDTMARRIGWEIRVPRIAIDILVGMCLALAGAFLQGVMHNPLADPGIIGVSSGAGVMAVLIMIIMPGYLLFLPVAAFVGGFLAAMLVYALSVKRGGSRAWSICSTAC